MEPPLKTQLISSEWKISAYLVDHVDQSAPFEGVVLTFKKNGTLVYKSNGMEINGLWKYRRVALDFPFSIEYINIIFTYNATAMQLDKEWLIINSSQNNISFEVIATLMQLETF
jgi:hypothetical protein